MTTSDVAFPVSCAPTGGRLAEPVLARAGQIWTTERGRALLALVLIVPVPAISALIARFVPGVKGEAAGQVLYFCAKAWIVLLPVLWLMIVDRGRINLSPMRRGGLRVGIITGAAIFIAIILAYLILGRLWIDPETVRAAAGGKGLDRLWLYVLSVCGLSLLNALVEEYVWRWFVLRKCAILIGSIGAVILGASLFTLHHIVSLRAHTGWDVTALGSAGCFVGGVIWSWLYLRYRSIWPGYVSHILADVAIYLIGWHLIFRAA
ncbi:MAG: CPBP family intramembrane metalloprotease [Phycisphaerales bacterium]|nr:MAG: CPBP family intramembrane metalloprotease [Phycisphaerales bacterium]